VPGKSPLIHEVHTGNPVAAVPERRRKMLEFSIVLILLAAALAAFAIIAASLGRGLVEARRILSDLEQPAPRRGAPSPVRG
jgi:hypothetical protein